MTTAPMGTSSLDAASRACWSAASIPTLPRTTHHAPRTAVTHDPPRSAVTHHVPRTTYHAPRTTHHAPRATYHAPPLPTTHVCYARTGSRALSKLSALPS